MGLGHPVPNSNLFQAKARWEIKEPQRKSILVRSSLHGISGEQTWSWAPESMLFGFLLQGAHSHVPLVSVECQGINSSAKGGRLNDPTFASPRSAYYQPKSWHNWSQAGSTRLHSIKSEVPDQHGWTWHHGFRTLLGCKICDMSSHLLSTQHTIPAWPFQESSREGREAWTWGSHSKGWC